MIRLITMRLFFLFVVVAMLFVTNSYFGKPPIDLPDPPRNFMLKPENPFHDGYLLRADGCVVNSEAEGAVSAATVHKDSEDAWIQIVNDDNTVQVQGVDSKLTILFEAEPDDARCFRKGSIALVTIVECAKGSNNECDFSLSHSVYVRTEPVNVIAWEYPEPSLSTSYGTGL